MTISRKIWKAIESNNIKVTRFEAFSWVVFQHIMPIGTTLVTTSTKDIERKSASNMAFYVRGIGLTENDSLGRLDYRIPGLFTPNRPNHPKGVTKITAIEEVEFWCFNWHANKGKLPKLKPLVLFNGEQYTSTNEKILVCAGTLSDHLAHTTFISKGQEYISVGDTYCLIFED